MLTANINTRQLDSLIKNLAFYRLAAKKRVDDVLAEGAFLIESDAKELSPVDTGLNRASIHAVREDYLKYKVAANAKYAMFLEFGTVKMAARPFLFPAYEKNKPAILAALKEAMKYKK